MKVYEVDFEGVWPVGNGLILCANDEFQANQIAKNTITHTDKFTVKEVKLNVPKVILYMSGDY